MLKEGPSTADLLRLFQTGLPPMAAVNLYPKSDFGKTDWRKLFANLRAGDRPAELGDAGYVQPGRAEGPAGPCHRIDSLVEQFATDWRVEFHQ
jgi:hypothetical protein